MKIRYFDHAATTYTKEEVLKEMLPYFGVQYGNPSSIYGLGREAKRAIEKARQRVAKVLNCNANEVYFTSGGTESDNIAIRGIAYANKNKGNHIITSKIEHHAVLNTCKKLEEEGFEVTYLNVDEDGIVDLNELKQNIKDTTILITIMFANNEIGTIQPLEDIGKIAKDNNIIFHTDAVQAIGNAKIDVKTMNIDALSMSAHKFYGPKGIGAVYIKKEIPFNKIMEGGHQERDKRPSTENVAGIVGLGKAIELVYDEFDRYNKKLIDLRDKYIRLVEEKIPNCKLNGHRVKRLPGNANFSFEFVDGEALLLNLDMEGICASAGSACSSSEASPSHVLTAIGLKSTMAEGSLRTTFGYANTESDIEFLVDKLEENIQKLRKKNR